jgi:hypothetical protein
MKLLYSKRHPNPPLEKGAGGFEENLKSLLTSLCIKGGTYSSNP